MKRKIDKSKLEACKLVWKKRIAAEKGISEKCAEKTVQSCIELIERMLYGNAMIAFHKQDGTFCMHTPEVAFGVGIHETHLIISCLPQFSPAKVLKE